MYSPFSFLNWYSSPSISSFLILSKYCSLRIGLVRYNFALRHCFSINFNSSGNYLRSPSSMFSLFPQSMNTTLIFLPFTELIITYLKLLDPDKILRSKELPPRNQPPITLWSIWVNFCFWGAQLLYSEFYSYSQVEYRLFLHLRSKKIFP